MKILKMKNVKKEYCLDNINKKLFDKKKRIARKKQINCKLEKFIFN